jgi:Arc/MetJ family transcription regulator
MRMKRTNLVLNAHTLDEALRVSGERTYSGAVQCALDDYVRRARARQILDLAGSGLWEGSLAEMRADSSGKKHTGRRRGSR